jgi:hypothetical protein
MIRHGLHHSYIESVDIKVCLELDGDLKPYVPHQQQLIDAE